MVFKYHALVLDTLQDNTALQSAHYGLQAEEFQDQIERQVQE